MAPPNSFEATVPTVPANEGARWSASGGIVFTVPDSDIFEVNFFNFFAVRVFGRRKLALVAVNMESLASSSCVSPMDCRTSALVMAPYVWPPLPYGQGRSLYFSGSQSSSTASEDSWTSCPILRRMKLPNAPPPIDHSCSRQSSPPVTRRKGLDMKVMAVRQLSGWASQWAMTIGVLPMRTWIDGISFGPISCGFWWNSGANTTVRSKTVTWPKSSPTYSNMCALSMWSRVMRGTDRSSGGFLWIHLARVHILISFELQKCNQPSESATTNSGSQSCVVMTSASRSAGILTPIITSLYTGGEMERGSQSDMVLSCSPMSKLKLR